MISIHLDFQIHINTYIRLSMTANTVMDFVALSTSGVHL